MGHIRVYLLKSKPCDRVIYGQIIGTHKDIMVVRRHPHSLEGKRHKRYFASYVEN